MSSETMSMVDAIKARHSVRTFTGEMSSARRAVIDDIIREVQNLEVPFHTNAQVADAKAGLSRMGAIKNEAGWLLAKIPRDADDLNKHIYDAAFRMHTFVLKMVQHGFGCVWVGGTYDRAKAEATVPGFSVPAVIAYGEDKQAPRLLERVTKWFMGSKNRKPLKELFYDGDNNRPFTEENAGRWLGFLQAVQSCPSAYNIQSWRLLITGNVANLYYKTERDLCRFDMGITMATMKLYAEANGQKVTFSSVENPPKSPLGGSYVVTCTVE